MWCANPASKASSTAALTGLGILARLLTQQVTVPLMNGNSAVTNECPSSLVLPEVKWDCELEMNIFTDTEPDDLWALIAIFSKATSTYHTLQCPHNKYPVKAVFGGGGFNSDITHDMLKEYLGYLKSYRIIPDIAFDIASQVHPGPVSAKAVDPEQDGLEQTLHISVNRFDRWGWSFGQLRHSPQDPDQDLLSTTMSSLAAVEATLRPQHAPLVVAMRPIFEFAVGYRESTRHMVELFNNATYEDQIRRLAWSSEQFQGLIDVFRKSTILMHQGTYNLHELGRFFRRQILSSDVRDATSASNALEEVFVQWPQAFLIADRETMLKGSPPADQDHAREDFSALTQSLVWAQFRRSEYSELRDQLSMATKDWNDGLLVPMRSAFRNIMNHYAPSQMAANVKDGLDYADGLLNEADMISQISVKLGPSFRALLTPWQARMDRLRRRIRRTDYPLNVKQTADLLLLEWKTLAPAAHSRIEVEDILAPLLMDPAEGGVVRSSLRRVDYAPPDPVSGVYPWPLASPDSQSTVWFTRAATPDDNVNSNGQDFSRPEQLHLDLNLMYGVALSRYD
ncbi:MAG: hypothetical protein M1838_000967 [Thelocarpon superellum]|nr:MAG: hypothetical protein M1838_000967 [Thelocarpon superellum]